jgi:hypothetical protein
MREAFKQVGASQLDEESKDAAMVRELQPGRHTVIVNDFNYTSGIVLIEIFELLQVTVFLKARHFLLWSWFFGGKSRSSQTLRG